MSLLPFDDRDGFLWLDGRLVEWRQAKLHVLSHGLHYGSGIFEGERAYNGRIFKSEEHTARLFESARIMDMPMPFTQDRILAAKEEVLRANGLTDAYVRPVAWRGAEVLTVNAQLATTHVAVAAWHRVSDDAAQARAEKGLALTMAPYRRPGPDMAPVHAKASGLYMICTISKHQALRQGFDDAVMLDYRNQVAEATGANLFLVRDGALHTPIADCFLNGITRRTVIDLARAKGYEVTERAILPEEMTAADEMFLVGTAAEVVPVSRLDDHQFASRDTGLAIRAAYLDLVRGTGEQAAAGAADAA